MRNLTHVGGICKQRELLRAIEELAQKERAMRDTLQPEGETHDGLHKQPFPSFLLSGSPSLMTRAWVH